MQHLVVTLKDSKINLSSIKKEGFSSISAEVSKEVLNGTKILNVENLANIIKDLTIQMGVTLRKVDISFVADSSDVFLRFLTIPKHTEDIDAQIIQEARAKFSDMKLENLYFSYSKIAPFVYQFIAIEKDKLESFMQVADALGIPLLTITPWVSILPKYVKTSDAAIFIVGEEGPETVALSELGGIFFCDRYSFGDKKFDLEQTVKDLSVYRRDTPITKIYALNYPMPEINNGYTVEKMEFNLGEGTDISGYEYNLLVHFLIDLGDELDNPAFNLLNLLPLPAVEKAPVSLVKVGSMAAGALALAMLLLVITGVIGGRAKSNELASADIPGETAVLSTQDASQATPSADSENTQPLEMDKTTLSIRVENGSGLNGMAAKTKALLEEKTYKVTEIDTAPATRDTTLLQFKKDKVDYQSLLEQDMGEEFGTIVVEDTLSDDVSYDLLIVLGTGINL